MIVKKKILLGAIIGCMLLSSSVVYSTFGFFANGNSSKKTIKNYTKICLDYIVKRIKQNKQITETRTEITV